MMKRHGIIMIAAMFISIAIVNYVVARHPVRADLTDKKIYTLSDSTRKILAGLDDVATVRVYFTENLPPAIEPLRRDTEDLLAEFKRAAGRRLQVEHVDPGSSGLEEQRAQLLGIPPVQLNVFNKDKQEVAKIYLGMAIMYHDKQQVIPVVQSTANLEYEIAEALVKVSTNELKRIAWWAPKESAQGAGFGLMKEFLSRRYEIADVAEKELADLTPDRFAALVLISPRALGQEALFAIDQYLMSGGKLLALVDRWDVGPQLSIAPVSTNAVDLLAAYGAAVEDSLVLDEQDATAAFGGGVVTYHIPYPYWPEVRTTGLDAKEPVTANLQSLVFPWTSPLTLNPDAATSGAARAIASTTQASAAIPGKDARLDPKDANLALSQGQHEARTVAAMLAGPFKSYFALEGRTPPQGLQVKTAGDDGARIFITGSSRWANDRFLQNFPQNAALFQNVLDLFAMGDVLIGIRSREETTRPIVEIPDSGRMVLRYANIATGPLALAAVGLTAFLLRRRRRHSLTREWIT
ncbi:MAG: GldG family protein [bacterium]